MTEGSLQGRRIRSGASGESEALKDIRHGLRRRAIARRPIGVSYRFRALIDPDRWLPVTLVSC